jgi:hypothetical protein
MSMGPHQLCMPDSQARCILDEFRFARALLRLILNAEESKPSMDVGQLGGKSGMDG